jgi:lipopolysaccharide biosynthesis glycosyltransferase
MQLVPARVLQESLLKYNSEYELVISCIFEEPEYRTIKNRSDQSVGTVFSLQRFLVAKIGARHGCELAFYIDSDIICLGDFSLMVRDYLQSGKKVCIADTNPRFRQPVQSAVMLVGTSQIHQRYFEETLRSYLEENISYSHLMTTLCDELSAHRVAHIFNSRDFSESQTVFLHYTDLWTQPWVSPFRREASIWMRSHMILMKSDFTYRKLVEKGVKLAYYRPGVMGSSGGIAWADLFFLPPQIKVYARRYRIFSWIPNFLLGGVAQLIAFVRASLGDHTT